MFPEFRPDEIKQKLFAHPFDLAVEDSPDNCQLEIIDLQVDMDSNRGYSEGSLVIVYKRQLRGKFHNLSRHARKIISLFDITYCCA